MVASTASRERKSGYLDEPGVSRHGSDFYVYEATAPTRRAMYHPLRIGHGRFDAGYRLSRAPMNNFLVAFIDSGSFHIRFSDVDETAQAGQFLLVDCYQPHVFSTTEPCSDLWLHYDGPAARPMYEHLVASFGNVIGADEQGRALNEMHVVYDIFKSSAVSEPLLAHHIDGILTTLADVGKAVTARRRSEGTRKAIESTVSYISAHLDHDLSLESLANQAMMNTYYFAKRFKTQVGLSPHQFVLNARIERAKFLLYSTDLPAGRIARECGFKDQSVFCAAFKRITGSAPSDFRRMIVLD